MAVIKYKVELTEAERSRLKRRFRYSDSGVAGA